MPDAYANWFVANYATWFDASWLIYGLVGLGVYAWILAMLTSSNISDDSDRLSCILQSACCMATLMLALTIHIVFVR